ncbi:DMT family transporter [Effusibacillus dendaii]|uniref:Transporter n=1 Tax=Effusibacillus dendaii TaxID=2743772 RepID=A0A7I8DKP7_9BACL|nr:DMT family transporter [Effusibacillus dendaii]BCJ88491.1 transporter [Effusibacillus dendaii]
MGQLSRTKTTVLITFLVVVWGVAWPIYKIALAYTPPLLFAGMRTLLGGLFLAVLLLPKRKLLRWKENRSIYLISSIFNVVIFYGVQSIGLRYIPAGLFSVIVYLQPILIGIFAWLWLGESMTALKVIGLILGFFGVAAVSSEGFTGHISGLGIVLALVTAVGWAVGTIYSKKVGHRVDAMWLSAFQCIIGGIILTGSGFVYENWSEIIWNVPYVFGLVFGVVLGISTAWVVYFTLVKAGDASKVASYTFLVPLISVFSGTLFLGEPFTVSLLIGLLLIAVSIYLVNRKPSVSMKQNRETA